MSEPDPTEPKPKESGRVLRGEDHPWWNGGKYEAPNGYVYVKKPDHPNAGPRGYVGEHRLVAADMIGRPLEDGEVVHHKNEDRSDNRPENLEVLTISEHMEKHRGEDSDLRGVDEPNPEIECACGCGQTLRKYDVHNRPRKYIAGHRGREQEAPTQTSVLEKLREDGPAKRINIINAIDTTEAGVKSAIEELKKKGMIEPAEGHGVWKISDNPDEQQPPDNTASGDDENFACPGCGGDLYRGSHHTRTAYKCQSANDCEWSTSPVGRTMDQVRRANAELRLSNAGGENDD